MVERTSRSVDLGMPVLRTKTTEAPLSQTPEVQISQTPFKTFILKTESRCNLSCDYCYVYSKADQSWREQPVAPMSPEVFAATGKQIALHAKTHNLEKVNIFFLGGDPLLPLHTDPDYYTRAVNILRYAIPEDVKIDFGMQTNGVLLTEKILENLNELGISVGVSLDGNEQSNDRHRKYRNGKGSYLDVAQGLELLQKFPKIYRTINCVVDIDSDPLDTYESLKIFRPRSLDFLLPHGNWSELPPKHDPYAKPPTTNYADWLIRIFDKWYIEEGAPPIRLFKEIARLGLGMESNVEFLGLTPPDTVVVETDGSIEQVDTLKSVAQGAAYTGLSVFRNTFDDVLIDPKTIARRKSEATLSQDCISCNLLKVCGAGYIPHRYDKSKEEKYKNRSVYCADLAKLIKHIVPRVREDLETFYGISIDSEI